MATVHCPSSRLRSIDEKGPMGQLGGISFRLLRLIARTSRPNSAWTAHPGLQHAQENRFLAHGAGTANQLQGRRSLSSFASKAVVDAVGPRCRQRFIVQLAFSPAVVILWPITLKPARPLFADKHSGIQDQERNLEGPRPLRHWKSPLSRSHGKAFSNVLFCATWAASGPGPNVHLVVAVLGPKPLECARSQGQCQSALSSRYDAHCVPQSARPCLSAQVAANLRRDNWQALPRLLLRQAGRSTNPQAPTVRRAKSTLLVFPWWRISFWLGCCLATTIKPDTAATLPNRPNTRSSAQSSRALCANENF